MNYRQPREPQPGPTRRSAEQWLQATMAFEEELHRDWNWEGMRQAPRAEVAFQVDGEPAAARLASWETPHRISAARFTIGGEHGLAISLGLSRDELIQALGMLTWLQPGSQALADHQGALEERAGSSGSSTSTSPER